MQYSLTITLIRPTGIKLRMSTSLNIPATARRPLKPDVPFKLNISMMTARHNSHSGLQMQSWRGRRVNPGRAGLSRRVLITGKYSSQGPARIAQLCLHPSSSYVMAPPATEGGLEEPFETMAVQSRTDVRFRSCSNTSRGQR